MASTPPGWLRSINLCHPAKPKLVVTARRARALGIESADLSR